jgi:glycosyltransferase involved in cell wall biosynthesis
VDIEKQNPLLVSVILPVYNRKYILERTLNSLIRQTFKDYELIIVDDGSTDKVEEIIFSYLEKYQNFKYISHSNRGVALSRNAGILISQGTYITFIDSDDEYKTEHLEKMVNFMQSNPYTDFIHSLPDMIGNEEDMWLPDANDPTKLIHPNDCVYSATFFGKKEVFIQMQGFKNVPFEDSDFYKRLVSYGRFKIQRLEEKTYIYYRNIEDSICNNLKKLYLKCSPPSTKIH